MTLRMNHSPKYSSPEAVQGFMKDLEPIETGELVNLAMFTRIVERRSSPLKNPLRIAEALLYMLESREDYETCAKVLKNYPELQVSTGSDL